MCFSNIFNRLVSLIIEIDLKLIIFEQQKKLRLTAMALHNMTKLFANDLINKLASIFELVFDQFLLVYSKRIPIIDSLRYTLSQIDI